MKNRKPFNFRDSIKFFAKKILGAQNISSFKNRYRYVVWICKGKPVPAHGIYKWNVIKKYAKKHGIEVFIETGTAGGGTVVHLARHFKQLFTIELDPTLYKQGVILVGNNKKIICVEGDSGIKVKEILQNIDEPVLFWLDAHYSGYGTARGAIDTPIVQELLSIFSHKNKNHIVIVDDMREFNGTNDYPEINELKEIIKDKAPWCMVSQDNDMLIIEPIIK